MRRLLCALMLAMPASLFAADWPIFRGNAAQTGVVVDPLPAPLVERWKFRLGADKSGIASTEATAAIAAGVVFIGGVDDHVHALDLKTGAEKWKLKTGPIKAPLAAENGVVYAGNMDGTLHCIDAATGKDRWHVDLGDEITSGINILGENILLGCRDETLYCLSKTDGAVRWKFAINGGPVMGTPALIEGKTFAAGCDSTLHILNAADGKELSTVDLGGQVASAAVRDGKLYVGTMSPSSSPSISPSQKPRGPSSRPEVASAFSRRRPSRTNSSSSAAETNASMPSIERRASRSGAYRPTAKSIARPSWPAIRSTAARTTPIVRPRSRER